MNLYEYEGKEMLKKYGLQIPEGFLIHTLSEALPAYKKLKNKKVFLKMQSLATQRKAKGQILQAKSEKETQAQAQILFKKIKKSPKKSFILIEKEIDHQKEHFISIFYDDLTQGPVLLHSDHGGSEIENTKIKHITKISLDVRTKTIILPKNISQNLMEPIQKIWTCFKKQDLTQIEINPLVQDKNNVWLALDAKISTDENAFWRHHDYLNFKPRTLMNRAPTKREQQARKIDRKNDFYRGTASTYVELDGDIAVLFSGGGASIVCMDALIEAGGEPANYTEYSGNPPKEKISALTKTVLSKPNLTGLWIVGGIANFTDIETTFDGIIEALDAIKPRYPIVVRRAGPHDTEAIKKMRMCAKRNNLHMQIFDKQVPMTETAYKLVEEIQKV